MVMEDRNDEQKMEEMIMLPGFRFHPTDEELVGFYLKKKIQGNPISIELIKPLDIYKHDPWDLPRLATTSEKEWYFYCRRDRKYRNSARPNRVTRAGFWKATGTDRPIYSVDGSNCIGLKKSLVFYKGRAAKGFKTDWMMHEFRLPSVSHHTAPTTRFHEKTIPPNELWAICRVFKKASSSSQRALSLSWPWVSPTPILPITPSPSNIDPTPPTLSTINNTPPQLSISTIPVHEPTYNITTTIDIDANPLLINIHPPSSSFKDFGEESLDYNYSINGEQQSFCSSNSTPAKMQQNLGYDDQDQEHMTDLMYFEDKWDFFNPNSCYI